MQTGIYVRVSTEEQAQEGYSIRAQQEKLKDYVKIKDWTLYKVYADEGISGKNLKDRPAVNALIADIKDNKVKNVLVFKIDRLTRNTVDLIQLVDLFNQYHCAFNSLMESIDTQTASGRMFLKIIGTFAEFERENIAERVKIGFERRAKEGYSTCSFVSSYGYNRKKGEKIQTVNEKEAEIVKEIFDMFVNQNMTLTGIAKRLNIREVPTKKDKQWNIKVIRDILTNCNYVGKVRYALAEDTRYFEAEGRHRPIVSQEIFNEAQFLLSKLKKINITKKPRDENYYCGFLVCGKCGKKLATHTNYRKRADGTGYLKVDYYCTKRALNACNASSISHNKVERAFAKYLEHVEDFIVDNEFKLEEHQRNKERNIVLKKEYEAQLVRLEKKQKEIMHLYIKGDIQFVHYNHMKELLDTDKTVILEEINKINTALNQKIQIKKEDIIVNLKENWNLLSDIEKRRFFIKFIHKITIVNEKTEKAYITTIKDVEFNDRL